MKRKSEHTKEHQGHPYRDKTMGSKVKERPLKTTKTYQHFDLGPVASKTISIVKTMQYGILLQ